MPLVAGLTAGVLGLGTLSVYALDQRNEARTQTDIATQALERAQDAQLDAEAQAAAADDARKEADDERAAAEEAKLDADEQRDIAQQKTQEAEAALADAQAAQAAEAEQRQRAEEGEAEASRQAEVAREQTSIAENNAAVAQAQTQIAQEATQRAETSALNANIQAENLRGENLIAGELNFKAWLNIIALTLQNSNARSFTTAIWQTQSECLLYQADLPDSKCDLARRFSSYLSLSLSCRPFLHCVKFTIMVIVHLNTLIGHSSQCLECYIFS
jgi:hypothetical protein